MEKTDAQKLAQASSFLLWLHSPTAPPIYGQKLADGLPPAEGEEHQEMTGDYKAPLAEVLSAIQVMIETELATALAYSTYAESVRGFCRMTLSDEFHEHADKETEHAQYLMRRASVLGGPLQLNPITPPVGSTDPTDIIQRMIRMEQEGLLKWRLLHSLLGDTNPMKFKVEEYLTDEEEHLDDLIQLLPAELRPPELQSTVATPDPMQGLAPKTASARKLADYIPTPLAEAPSSLDAQAKAEEDANAAAYHQQRAQEQAMQLEQFQQQLQELQAQLQQKEQEVAQKDQLMQQQQQVTQQANDVAARALANQLSTMQNETLLRQQTTDTLAGHEAWKQNVMQALSAPVPHPNQPEPPPQGAEGSAEPPPEGPQPNSPPSAGQGPAADTSPLAPTTQEGKTAASLVKDVAKEVLKDQVQGLAPKVSLGRGAGILGMAAAGAGLGYMGAKSPTTLDAARAAVDHAQGQKEQNGGFMNALQLARSKANLARAEAEAEHPGAAAGVGALKGGLAALSAFRALDAIKNI